MKKIAYIKLKDYNNKIYNNLLNKYKTYKKYFSKK